MKNLLFLFCFIYHGNFQIINRKTVFNSPNKILLEKRIDKKISKIIWQLNHQEKSSITKNNSVTSEWKHYFTESGYIILKKNSKTETWIPYEYISGHIATQTSKKYQFIDAKVVHYQDFKATIDNKFMAKATVYDRLTGFNNNQQPICEKVSVLNIPFDKLPISEDYWQVIEMKVKESKK